MFERRVRIVLGLLIAVAVGLVARAAQVQVAQAAEWRAVAQETMRRTELTETTRGRILDVKGRILAEDVPCTDAAVAYWFITEHPDEDRLYRDVARPIARERTPGYAQLPRAEQHRIVLSYMPEARARLEAMWDTLARVGGVTRAEIDATRRDIVARVEHRRKHVILARFQRATEDHARQNLSPWWRKWLLGEADAPPELGQFDETIADEEQAHVILPALSPAAYNELRKLQPTLPGLALTTSTTRHYPYANATAHVVGMLGQVDKKDLAADPDFGDELRAYLNRDRVGRGGLEQLYERRLRGARGRVDVDLETGRKHEASQPVPGSDVHTTIDAELQRDLAAAFQDVKFEWPREPGDPAKPVVRGPAPGAAVVIDVKTGAVRAIVSYPDFDPNTYDQNIATLNYDDVNRPLTNRAVAFAAVPGSTVKPIVGLAAIAEGLMGPHDTIECDGFLRINGKAITNSFRCWTESMFSGQGLARHQGGRDEHPTPDLNPGFTPPPGHLTRADALQRSCNVFFETLAVRLGEAGMNKWMAAFGLGQPTGLGLAEQRGLLLADMPPAVRNDPDEYRANVIMSGTGQSYVQATPLQIANVAATLARGGVVVRPTLTEAEAAAAVRERRDLRLDRDGLDMVRRGMEAVVLTAGGSGHGVDATLPVVIAAKTGSAQAHPLRVPLRDAYGDFILDENGRRRMRALELSTRDHENPEAPWFRRVNPMTDEKPRQSHAWFVGYAPAENPQVAFAVFVEYGGSGGASAGSVVTKLFDSLVRNGYIEPTRRLKDQPGPDGEPLYEVGKPQF